jgi:2-hydroxy-3-oxopropionate reductase
MTMRVGVLGLGVIGKPIATRLVGAGFEVAVFDVRDEPVAALKAVGAVACVSPAAVAARSEIIISLVSDAAQTDAVVSGPGGILGALRSDSTFVAGSTLGPAPVRAVAALLAAKGCATLDAPISGGYLAAAEGTLSLMIGGAQSTLDQAMPVLRAFAANITRVGDVGAGQVAKLAHQLVCSVNVMTLLEGLALGVAGGVEPEALKQVLREGVADSRVLRLWDDLGPRWKGMLKAAPPDGQPSNLQKDLHLVLDLARELGIGLHVTPAASDTADRGVATGRDNQDL